MNTGRRTTTMSSTDRRAYRSRIDTRVSTWALGLPEWIIDLLISEAPITVDGRTLNRQLQLLLKISKRLGLRLSAGGQTVEQRRAELNRAATMGMPLRRDIEVTNRTFPGPAGDVPIRLYRGYGSTGPVPAIVFYHGGGWVTGDLDSHDGPCRVLAAESGCVVVSVDYRLAPEHPFPAAVDDSIAAYEWVHHNADELSVLPGRVGVMGDSAGGNLAAVVSLRTRGADVPAPVAQCLVYPGTDMFFETRSHDLFANGFFLERESMEWFRSHYLPDESQWGHPDASPSRAEDLSGAAPAYVVTAGFDPLRDEGHAYADALAEAGVQVAYRCYDDMVHGFFGMGVLPNGLARIAEICAVMGEMMHAP